MNISYLSLIILLVLVFLIFFSSKKNVLMYLLKRKNSKKKGIKTNMNELLKNFIDKDCIIYMVNGTSVDGIIKEVKENAVLIENNEGNQLINTDFIVRLREYPKNKNGKRKGFVMD